MKILAGFLVSKIGHSKDRAIVSVAGVTGKTGATVENGYAKASFTEKNVKFPKWEDGTGRLGQYMAVVADVWVQKDMLNLTLLVYFQPF